MKRAILYTRISKEDKDNSGFGLAQQKRALYDYCKTNSIEVAVHFEDRCSGKDFERPKWRELSRFAKQNKKNIDLLLFTKWDRLGRNIHLTFSAINHIKELGIELNGIEQSLDLNLSESKILLAIYLSMGEVERDIIKSRTKKGMMEAKRQGRWCGPTPLGYKYIKSEITKKPLLVFNSPKAEFVKRAFELYSEGIYSIPEVRSKVIREFDNTITLSKQGFINLLNNRVYSGLIKVDRLNPKDDEYVLGLHEPIISDLLFQRVSLLLKQRKVTKNIRNQGDERFQLRGFLSCSICGKNITGSAVKKKRFAYYHCQNGHRFKAEEANLIFQKTISDIFKIDDGLIEIYEKVLKEIFNEDNEHIKKSMQRLDGKISQLRDNYEKIKNDYVDRKITADSYNELKNDITTKINSLTFDKATLSDSLKNNLNNYLDGALPLLKDLSNYYKTAGINLKRTLLKVLIDGKMVYSDKEYQTLRFKPAIELLLRINKGFREKRKGQNLESVPWSSEAPKAGLEPATL